MYAGFWKRAAASIIDGIILWTATIFFAVITPFGRSLFTANMQFNRYYLLFFSIDIILTVLYSALFESSAYQATPGKMAFGIIVTDMSGKRITFWRAICRCFSKWVSHWTFGIGYVMAGFTVRKQALHDKIVETLVINKTADANNLQPLPPAPAWQIFLACIIPITLILIAALLYFNMLKALSANIQARDLQQQITNIVLRDPKTLIDGLLSNKSTATLKEYDLITFWPRYDNRILGIVYFNGNGTVRWHKDINMIGRTLPDYEKSGYLKTDAVLQAFKTKHPRARLKGSGNIYEIAIPLRDKNTNIIGVISLDVLSR
jgi:uncharacterized RDD family membrane protein YckC